jgi:hypothetical protein
MAQLSMSCQKKSIFGEISRISAGFQRFFAGLISAASTLGAISWLFAPKYPQNYSFRTKIR